METHDLSIEDLYAEGNRRLDDKIARLQARPDIKFSDFGTRRRFSAKWHEHVVSRLAQECSENFVGTSNPWFAYKYDLTPIGTFAHEMPMVYAGLEDANGGDPLDGHTKMLKDWQDHYKGDLSVALTDTFGSEFFFTDFTAEQAHDWRGLRHDSGDPFDFGERVIDFYAQHEIDPTTKTIVFSDGLDIDMIEKLADHFSGRINLMFGWGTSLTNDLGLPSNNIVMKATHVNQTDTVKLSDNIGKHTGPERQVQRYQSSVAGKLSKNALRQVFLA
jgi:nicotinate phosphoribosyltransferase